MTTEAPAPPERAAVPEPEWVKCLIAALVPAGLTIYLSFNDGGYFPGATGLAAAEVLIFIAALAVVARRPFAGLNAALVLACVALIAFAGWNLLSSTWSEAPARAYPEFDRAVLYAAVLALFGLLGYSARQVRWMMYGLATAIVGVCTAGFVSRTAPDVILDVPTISPERLSYPLTYWNSVGLLAAIGIVFCAHLACSTRDRWPARVLAAASIPVLASTLLFTFSRGSVAVAAMGLVVYFVVGRPRAAFSGLVACVPFTAIAVLAANSAGTLTPTDPPTAEVLSQGHRVLVVVGFMALGAGIVRALLLPLDVWARDLRLPDRGRRPIVALALGLSLAVVLAGCTALNVPERVQEKYREFTSNDSGAQQEGSGRLSSAGDNGRRRHWRIAMEAYHADPLRGAGAGTYGLLSNRLRAAPSPVHDAHSLYYETLGELGLPGLIFLIVVIALVLGAFAARARGPDRALFAALLAAGLAWTVHAFFDWDWEVPAATLWLFAAGGAALAGTARPTVADARLRLAGRAALVVACLGLAVLPIRMAISELHMDRSLQAFRGGDCGRARDEARAALSALGQRAAPYHVIASCELPLRRPRKAVAAMRAAVERDPANWELRYALGVARAAAGLDPRPQLRKALAANPHEPLAIQAVQRFRGSSPAQWRREATATALTEPGLPTP